MIDRCYLEITNVCNLNCHFCPKHAREKRQMTAAEYELLTDKLRGEVCFLYFHLMGEPMLHPLLPQFIRKARAKGFKTVLTSNGTLLHRAPELLEALPHKIQLSLHSHESNGRGCLTDYVKEVMDFAEEAARRGTCMVLRLWNQGGRDQENPELIRMLEQRVPRPWVDRPDGYRMRENLYLEFDRKYEWPESLMGTPEEEEEHYCKALVKQIGVLCDGSLVPCCLDNDGRITLGNLLTQSLDEILHSARAQAMAEGFAHHQAVEPLCQHCESGAVNRSFRGNRKATRHRTDGAPGRAEESH